MRGHSQAELKIRRRPSIPKTVLSVTDFVILFRDFVSSFHSVISFRDFVISSNTESSQIRLLCKLQPCEI